MLIVMTKYNTMSKIISRIAGLYRKGEERLWTINLISKANIPSQAEEISIIGTTHSAVTATASL